VSSENILSEWTLIGNTQAYELLERSIALSKKLVQNYE
jgi:hypothetical protein